MSASEVAGRIAAADDAGSFEAWGESLLLPPQALSKAAMLSARLPARRG
jgi:hypothetical protein